jgi:hypothetical protein
MFLIDFKGKEAPFNLNNISEDAHKNLLAAQSCDF